MSEHELASRMASFFWSSVPDDELMRLSETKTLRRPEVLEAQVRRMLQDQKSKRLVEDFGGQWLQFRGLESVRPDINRFGKFDDYIRMSMRQCWKPRAGAFCVRAWPLTNAMWPW